MLKKFYFSLIFFVAVIVWLFQGSISNFWPQDRNLANPLAPLSKYESWSVGEKINYRLQIAKIQFLTGFTQISYNLTAFVATEILHNPNSFKEQLNSLLESQQELAQELVNLENEASQSINQENEAEHESVSNDTSDLSSNTTAEVKKDNLDVNDSSEVLPVNIIKSTLKANEYVLGNLDGFAGKLDYAQYGALPSPSQIELKTTDRVLLIGDSMQQGVGRHIRSWLQTEYKIEAINLAKQSTGFVNPKNLDWNETVRSELARNSYRLMIVLIGANDTYGLTDSNTGKIYKYGSEGWKAHYAQRVMSVLYEARSHGLDVIWILGPAMKSSTANDKIKIANQIYTDAVQQYGGILVSADKALGYPQGEFGATQSIDGKAKKIRANDGTHFTIAGEQLIAHAVRDHIKVQSPQSQAVIPLPKMAFELQQNSIQSDTVAEKQNISD